MKHTTQNSMRRLERLEVSCAGPWATSLFGASNYR
jgi:hypothetical protein